MRALSLTLLLTAACSTPSSDDEAPDTDATGTDEPVDSDDPVVADTDPVADTDVDLGEEIFSDSFETPALNSGDWTGSLTGWLGEWPAMEGSAAVGVVRPAYGLAALSPFDAPGDGSQALFLNARSSTWARATRDLVTMSAGVTYTLTAALALRTDVATPTNMSVSLYNGDDSDAVATETPLRDLIADTITGEFQSITLTYTAGPDDDGDPLTVRFGILHTEGVLAQLLIDDVRLHANTP